jgi:hypothetical protein
VAVAAAELFLDLTTRQNWEEAKAGSLEQSVLGKLPALSSVDLLKLHLYYLHAVSFDYWDSCIRASTAWPKWCFDLSRVLWQSGRSVVVLLGYCYFSYIVEHCLYLTWRILNKG